ARGRRRRLVATAAGAKQALCFASGPGKLRLVFVWHRKDRPMSKPPAYGFETLAVHAGTPPDPATGARAMPIYQTTAYVFDDVDQAASLFNLQTYGYIYSRLTNPTVSALEERM